MTSLKRYRQGARLYVAFLVGRVPVLALRHAVYRRLGMRLAPGAVVHWRAVFFAPEGVSLGERSVVGNDCFLDGRKRLTIGRNVNIGGHVHIFTMEHDPQDAGFRATGAPVVIEDRAYVASRATVLPGVTIGEGAVVAAGAVVVRDVAPYTIVGGVPAREIGTRSRDLTYELGTHLPFQ
ncbi:acyltransferase [Cellulomonas sp. MW9]|uniref:Acyltransferase n=2 Tax=Cellulomonas edaphi TaxID=3053468 RepID=A0ABT7S4X8_9CELL|nr:acyltransferase [Cellulomons edaphi]